jgi:parvulin-like peptidyl-prolyl isomerase
MVKRYCFILVIVCSVCIAPVLSAKQEDKSQILVTVDESTITRGDLQTALSSSPFYTQFNTLDENIQASMRGDLLKRMVSSRLLAIEAKRLKLDSSPAFIKELGAYEKGLQYRQYVSQLQQNIRLNDAEVNALREKYKGQADAFSAAKSSAVAIKYKALLKLTLLKLRESMHVKLYEERIVKGIRPDTVLMEADNDLRISYADIVDVKQYPQLPDVQAIKEKLYQYTEFLLITRVAKQENIVTNKERIRYQQQRLPSLLAEQKEQEWGIDNDALKAYYLSHPQISQVSDQWHIGQIVLKTEAEAKEIEAIIKSGKKSLFQLAGERSIDVYGKERNGDMGWIKQGGGMPEIEAVLKELKDNELSPIIKTARGFHLITILKRQAGKKVAFQSMKDKLRQRILSEKMNVYLKELQGQHKIAWHVVETNATKLKALAKSKGYP